MATVTGEALQHRAVGSLICSAVVGVIIAVVASVLIKSNVWWWLGFGGGTVIVGAFATLIGWLSSREWYAELAEFG